MTCRSTSEQAQVLFLNDADLIGCSYQVVIGEKGLKEGQIELKERRTGAVTKLAPSDVATRLKELLGPVLN